MPNIYTHVYCTNTAMARGGYRPHLPVILLEHVAPQHYPVELFQLGIICVILCANMTILVRDLNSV